MCAVILTSLGTVSDLDCGQWQAIEDQGIKVYSFEEFAALGAGKPAEATPPAPEDYCTIMYTSGTTGDPKARTRDLVIGDLNLHPIS